MAGLFRTFINRVPNLLKTAPTNTTAFRNFVLSTTLLKPRVQEPAPDFGGIAVVNKDFKQIKLADYKGKFVVLFFYPLDFTFVCPTELISLDERIDDFHSLNAEVIGCSIDSHFSHLGWINSSRKDGGLGNIRYPLLSDINKNIARKYDVLLENEGIALRGMFIIDPNGILRHITVNDLPIGRSVDEAIRIIEAIAFVDEHGEVCPANWKKGSKTIKPDPKGSLEYFNNVNK
ncbi:unnamed protein product [Phyllotreta striolata]|uniref:thioredoxin-dependent peroxiredoxin n=1 Tax=Phyllotreta striolata TaxID=444603 RepID=A0A9N9TPL3_PHYSR|nr:unnamed protein product [Phyllotreta striolata]